MLWGRTWELFAGSTIYNFFTAFRRIMGKICRFEIIQWFGGRNVLSNILIENDSQNVISKCFWQGQLSTITDECK